MLSGVLPPMVAGRGMGGVGSRHYFSAYSIEAFTDLDTFKDNMDQMLQTLKETKPAPGHDRVLYAGLSEYEEEQDRRANGIPLHKEVIQWFEDITGELSIPRLKTM
jgi:LDH2 family malate/lactate/ureidoglycolate dehydrogenase